ncbi:hypothetical protein GCM10010967_53220 [Dyadobacter beijingensis]|uniref:DUF6984 domain-containing protein n=1 Tax=Dyadobacter beijingensis TaxID=365489 RepID=A0ABQ2IJ11_9BACT|nr:hypothetical protein [Dyadobacter beijingensis]GGN10695.1 hypothetical protein GCM10010967_53220 [Dyadobacter beijingensis]
MESPRKATSQEESLLELLISKSSEVISKDWRDGLLVCSMDDGGMGSLHLFPNGEVRLGRTMGKQISEIQFIDQDNVEVLASLYVDTNGNLLELDIWKTDFSKLIAFPKSY